MVVAGGFTVSRLRTVFGTDNRPSYADTELEEQETYDPKELVYEVFGAPGTQATISYFDTDADPQLVEGVSLPWSSTYELSGAAIVGNLVAQGNGDNIGCRIIVDGEVKAERTSQGTNAFTFCVMKAG